MKKVFAVLAAFILSIGIFSAGNTLKAADVSSTAGLVSTSSGVLNVRKSASTSSQILTTLGKGSYVTLISKSGSWWYVEYAAGKFGYCHANYISALSNSYGATVNTTTGNLNVRSGAGTSYKIITVLGKGTNVVVLSESNGWSRILYSGVKTGYVSSQYLKKNSGSGSVILSIPDFKQTDSRWANVLIGNSGKTIGKIGCTTTAIAMMESYRQNWTIYPDVMSKQLSYTSSGDLYWPSDYIQTTNSSGYLTNINDLLHHQKKPVLIGAKDKYGKQHWVVVKGFSGGDPLNTANYLINDPGSNSRTTLKQFLNAYPTFYKLIYYR